MEKKRALRPSTQSLLLSISVLCARFLGVCSSMEYCSNDFEAAYRFSVGQKFGSDVITGISPLSFYSLALFLKVFGSYEWVVHLHIYFWWAIALWIGLQLAQRISNNSEFIACTIVLAAGISCPVYTYQNSYSYMSVALVGMAVMAFDKFLFTQKYRWIIISGILSGITILTKQNVGILTLPAFIIFLLISFQFKALIIWGVSLAVSIFFPIALWSREFSVNEIISLIFLDAGKAKGGLLLLARGIPRLVFPFKHGLAGNARVLEILCSFALGLIVVAWLFFRKPNRTQPHRLSSYLKMLWFIICGSLLFTLIPIPGFRKTFQAIGEAIGTPPGYLMLQTMVLVLFTALVWVLFKIKSVGTKREMFFTVFSLSLIFSVNTALPSYLSYSAPIVIPIVIVILDSVLSLNYRAFVVVASWVLFLNPIIDPFSPKFEKLIPISPPTFYRGLYSTVDHQKFLNENWSQIYPRVNQRTTLWLVNGGPNLAMGGIPVPTIVTLFRDLYSTRVEARVFENWNRQLPDRIVYGKLGVADDAKLLHPKHLEDWIARNYYLITRVGEVEIWARNGSFD